MRKTSAWPLAQLYVVLIIYASLYPFDQWRDQGISAWAFLLAPWPKYWSTFDIVANVLGYAPVGFLLVLSALRMGLIGPVVVITTLACAFLSLSMETLQTYLPARVPSWPDFVLNTAGACAGALLASGLETLGWIDRWSRFRARWFVRDSYMALPLMAVWPIALLFPVSVPLGLGQVWDRLENTLDTQLDGTPFAQWIPFQDFELEPLLPGSQLLCVALGLMIPCLLGFVVIKQLPQRLVYLFWVVAMALGASALSAALTYGPAHAWTWLGQPEILGLCLGLILVFFFFLSSPRMSATFLLLALVVQQSLLNQAPESAYFSQTIQTWQQGQFIRFHGLVQWLGWLWPYAVLIFALSRLSRETPSRRN